MNTDTVHTPQPLFDEAAERSVLGSILIDPKETEDVYDTLDTTDFYNGTHRALYAACKALYSTRQPIDTVTVTSKAGVDPTYLKDLLTTTPTSAHWSSYAKIVKEKSIRRQIVHIGQQIAESAIQEEDLDALLEGAEKQVLDVTQGSGTQKQVSLADSLFTMLQHINEAGASDGITGVPTGFSRLDDLTAGLQPSDYILFAARPSMGKTALALSLLLHAVERGYPTVLFNLEMSTEQLLKRLTAQKAQISATKLRTGKMTDEEWERTCEAADKLAELPFRIVDNAYTLQEIRRQARQYVKKDGVKLILIDYLQLIAPGKRYAGNKTNEVSEISRELKLLAKELDVPIVILSQLNRQVEGRVDKRPQLFDIRDSGSIEQDADIVAFLYRDDYYDPDSEDHGIAEVIIKKQRNGVLGTARMVWDSRTQTFYDLLEAEEKLQ